MKLKLIIIDWEPGEFLAVLQIMELFTGEAEWAWSTDLFGLNKLMAILLFFTFGEAILPRPATYFISVRKVPRSSLFSTLLLDLFCLTFGVRRLPDYWFGDTFI